MGKFASGAGKKAGEFIHLLLSAN
ncbi:MAG: hypothetical protein NXI04_26460 [Planctomycetaceae bacterium]|nr:hypothetical protein [Planctomycetaceae bacterium]